MAEQNEGQDSEILDEEVTDLDNPGTDTSDADAQDDWRKAEEERLRQMTPDELVAEAIAKEQSKRRLFARVKKQPKGTEQPKPKAEDKKEIKQEVLPTSQFVSRDELDERILRTSGKYDDEDLKKLAVIAKGEGISLIDASNHELFQLHLDKKADDKKKADAKMGASKGSGRSGSKKDPGQMTREEHEAYFRERQGL
jgi:hypothetical protein